MRRRKGSVKENGPGGLRGVRRALAVSILQVIPWSSAQAAALDVHGFRPWPGGDAFLQIVDPHPAVSPYTLTTSFDYAAHPLMTTPPGASEAVPLLKYLGTWNTQFSARWARGSVGLALPLYPLASGSGVHLPMFFGDLRLHGDLRFLDRARGPLGAGLFAEASLPTGNRQAWVSEEVPTLRAGVSLAAGDRHAVAANVAFATASGDRFGELLWGNRVDWAFGASTALTPRWRLNGELVGEHLLGEEPEGVDPAEAILTLRHTPFDALQVHLGGGCGLAPGVGASQYRLLFGVAWRFGPRPRTSAQDPDQDGVLGSADLCPDQAGDRQGALAGCPERGLALLETRAVLDEGASRVGFDVLDPSQGQRWESHGARWVRAFPPGFRHLAFGAPGLAGPNLRLDLEADTHLAVTVLFVDPATLPPPPPPEPAEPDQDRDGIPDATDQCPDQPEEFNLVDDKDGCPDGRFTRVDLEVRDRQGAALRNVRLTVLSGPSEGTWVLADGTLQRSFPEGKLQLRVAAPGHVPLDTIVEVPAERHLKRVLTLEPLSRASRLEVRVTRADGRPIPADLRWDLLVENRLVLADGTCVLDLAPGDYDFRAISDGFFSKARNISLAPNRTHVLDLILPEVPAESFDVVIPSNGLITFEPGTPVLSGDAYPALWSLADRLRAHPEILEVLLEGLVPHDAGGASSGGLALDAAIAARDYLVNRAAIAPERLQVAGREIPGEQHAALFPEARGQRPVLRARVRLRVEPVVTSSASPEGP